MMKITYEPKACEVCHTPFSLDDVEHSLPYTWDGVVVCKACYLTLRNHKRAKTFKALKGNL